MATITKNLGIATAYGYAKSKGYTGTEEEFAQAMADFADVSAEAETLEPDDEATASYSGGVLSFGIPKGDKGDTGETGATGATGATGNGIASITKTGTSGLVDTYTITFTDGTTTTFDVTNGAEAIDDTLSIAGRAADAKATGDTIDEVRSDLTGFEKAKKDRAYLDGVVTSNAWKQSNISDYATTQGLFLSADVIGGATYYISGVSINKSFPLAIYVDENNTVIGTLYTADDTVSEDKEIITPDNCTKIYINGRKWGLSTVYKYPSIYYISYDTDILDSIASDIKAKQSISYRWDKAESTETENAFAYMISGNLEIRTGTAANGYKYAMLDDYNTTHIYRFYGTCKATTVPIVICCDANDIIIKTYGNTVGDVYKGQILTDIPQITKRIYVNGTLKLSGIEIASERKLQSLVAQKIGVALGDSITQGANVYVSNTITPYKDYPTIASEQLGCKIYNGGLGGGAYSGGRSIDFVNVANCIVTGDYTSIIAGIDQYSLNQSAKVQYADIADLDFNEVDFITLSYGTNDWNFGRTISEITTAMISGISALLTAYPHLKIYVFTPIFRFNVGGSGQDSDTYVNATSGLTLPQACEAIKTCANNLCLPCKDMYYESNINPYTKVLYMGDDTHPNANGYAVMGEKVARFINSH